VIQSRNISVIDSLKHYLKFLEMQACCREPSAGAVRTYIGGIDYRYFKYDHVSQAKTEWDLPLGSLYNIEFENGLNPCAYFH
jgi:penicillin-binding protein 1A